MHIVRANANIVPILECFEKYGDSNFEAFYGYRSFENETVVIPQGANNRFIGWEVMNNPIYFNPGRSRKFVARVQNLLSLQNYIL